MNKYIIAIDGGGTKTKGALFDLNGIMIKTIVCGFSNFSVDEEKSKQHIEETIDALISNTIKPNQIVLVMGIAGASKLSNPQRYIKELESKYQIKAQLETDAMIALYSVDQKNDEDLIMIISGTGSVMMTKRDDLVQMQGGYGHLFGDEGSSYHISLEAIKSVLEDLENKNEDSFFTQNLLKYLDLKNRNDIINYVYSNQKNDLSKIALEVSRLALLKDSTAINLLKNEGIYLGKQVVRNHLRYRQNKCIAIALRGGFILNAPYVKDAFVEYISNHISNFRIIDESTDALIGAFKLGIKKIQSEVTL